MSGRKVPEPKLAERAAKRQHAKALASHAAEVDRLGPLFAHEAPTPPAAPTAGEVRALMFKRRFRWADDKEGLREHLDANGILDVLGEARLEAVAAEHIPAGVVARLREYRWRTYPHTGEYGRSFWARVLTTTRRVVFGYAKVPDPACTLGFRTVEAEFWPPDGWAPPLKPDDPALANWERCPSCGLWHAPGQAECLPPLPAETAKGAS